MGRAWKIFVGLGVLNFKTHKQKDISFVSLGENRKKKKKKKKKCLDTKTIYKQLCCNNLFMSIKFWDYFWEIELLIQKTHLKFLLKVRFSLFLCKTNFLSTKNNFYAFLHNPKQALRAIEKTILLSRLLLKQNYG